MRQIMGLPGGPRNVTPNPAKAAPLDIKPNIFGNYHIARLPPTLINLHNMKDSVAQESYNYPDSPGKQG